MGGHLNADDGSVSHEDQDQDREHQENHCQIQEPVQEPDQESDQESDQEHDHGPHFDEFLSTIRLDELYAAASNLRDGLSCQIASHTVGGFNVIFEIRFSDNVAWMARIPLPYNCFQPEEISASYAATMRYLKKHSKLPVPQVFAFCRGSDPTNKTNVTYTFMEKMKGHHLPTIEKWPEEATPAELAMARKVHTQLADVILQLATLQFDKIGSINEDTDGNFFVGPYIDSYATAYPEYKVEVYKSLEPQQRGPFNSISSWYRSMGLLQRKFVLGDPEEEEESRDASVAQCEVLAEFAPSIALRTFEKGPFVINHNDLSPQNILVDDDFNFTAILDFPGNVVPLPSLCVFPWMFSDNLVGLVVDREAYREVFVKRKCSYNSALSHIRTRKRLMKSAENRQSFEIGLLGPYAPLVIPVLYEDMLGREFDSKAEYGRISKTRGWFKRLIKPGDDGLYSWEREEEVEEEEEDGEEGGC